MKKMIRLFIVLPLLLAAGLVACTNYGKKVSHGHLEVFYKDGVSEEQAQKTADLLYEADVAAGNNTSVKKSIQLVKDNDGFCFRMVVDKEKMEKLPDDGFFAIGSVLSDSIFNNSPVKVDLTDNHFKTIRTVPFKKVNYSGESQPVDSSQEQPADSAQ